MLFSLNKGFAATFSERRQFLHKIKPVKKCGYSSEDEQKN